MNWDVMDLRLEGDHAFRVRFKDGVEGVVKFMPSAFRGVFAPLLNPAEFSRVTIVEGIVTWPGELDLAPDAMYAEIAQRGEWILN